MLFLDEVRIEASREPVEASRDYLVGKFGEP